MLIQPFDRGCVESLDQFEEYFYFTNIKSSYLLTWSVSTDLGLLKFLIIFKKQVLTLDC